MANMSLSQLSKISHRLATGVDAGLDDLSLWKKEAQRGPLPHQARMKGVVEAISRGESVGDSLLRAGNYFPDLFIVMVKVGEASGRQGAVYRRLYQHYDHLLKLRSNFMSMIYFPALEIFASLVVIALLILALGWVGSVTNTKPIDIFGLGFSTAGNFALFLTVVGVVFGSFTFVILGLLRGWFGPGPTLLALRIPVLGQTLRLMSLSRMAWSFGMAIDSGIPAKECMRLGLMSSQNSYYQSLEEQLCNDIQAGESFQTALAKTGAFPDDFVDAVEAGELSGTITETMERLSDEYRDQAANLFRVVTVVGGFMVMGVVMVCIAATVIMVYKRLVIDQYQELLEF